MASARSAPANAVTVIDHPLVRHHLTRLRDVRTGPEEFRRELERVSRLLVYEAMRSWEAAPVQVRTPLARARGARLRRPILIVPILRAGLGMSAPLLSMLPGAHVGFVGVRRDPRTLRAIVYHKSLPADVSSSEIVVIDPMLATGGSAVAALDALRARGARRWRLVSLVAAPEGIARVHRHYAELPIFTAAIDPKLDARGYIVPGLGDAGDRLFGV